ncbi:MAG: DUF2264 domain-containing protein [Candidatus Glassbacteria bacterium]|nr:DUF2264 domain-containing protein [Candidatus Glassbacteria bacterium]
MSRTLPRVAVFCLSACALCAACLSAASPAAGPEARLQLKAAPDKTLSPYTGYTREHWVEIAGRLIAGFLPYFDKDTGMPDFRGTDAESGHFKHTPGFTGESRNAFGRTMILASLYSAATGLNTVPGYGGPLNGPYLTGIIRGTDPEDPAYWGPTERYGAFGNQIAQAVMYCPEYYWEPLSRDQKERLAAWLRVLAEGVGFECNCWYFNTAAVPVLERYGYPYDCDYITEKMERLLNWYSGSGFFIDGWNRSYDYYNFWGFQMFNLFHYSYTDPWRAKFGRAIRESTAEFMESFPMYFGSDGAPVPFGRSLSYRWAAVCPLGYAEAAGLGTLPPGMERRIASACLKHFWEKGAMSANGLLQVGWHGPNAMVGEDYLHRGAPYWASVGFSPLLLAADHPFWTETEQPMPADNLDRVRVVPGAQLVLRTNSRRGEARLYPVGSPRYYRPEWDTGNKYYQHAYSSALGFIGTGTGKSVELAAGRSGVSLDGRTWGYRHQPAPGFLSLYHNTSVYSADLGAGKEARVYTNTLILGDGEVHGVYHDYPEPLYIRVGGYGIAVPHGAKAAQAADSDSRAVRVSARPYESLLKILEGPAGRLEMVEVAPRQGWNHSHLFGGTGAFPRWTSSAPVPPKTLVIFYNDAARDEALQAPEVKISPDEMDPGLWVEVDGRVSFFELF